jgi:hypothetical protein
MSQPKEFLAFELAPNDLLWVQPTSMYGLLHLLFDPIGWVASRKIGGRSVTLTSPYVITFEPHAADHGIPANQILVQGIDGTGLITVHAGPAAGAQLMDHVHAAPHYQAFEQAALAGAAATPGGADATHVSNLRTVLLPALFRVLHRTDLDQPVTPSADSAALFQKYKQSHLGKNLDTTIVHSSGQGRDFAYVHFQVWPNPGSLGATPSSLAFQERVAEKQAEIALFQYSSVTDPTFLTDVMNGGKVSPSPSSYMWSGSTQYTLAQGGSAPTQARFTLPTGGLRIVHIGKEHPVALAQLDGQASNCADSMESACEILVGAPQTNGTTLLHEAYCKPYE